MSAHQKRRRRLAKNNASATAARHAQDVYIANLEFQSRAYDIEMTNMEHEVALLERDCDQKRQLNMFLCEHGKALQHEIDFLRASLNSQVVQDDASPTSIEFLNDSEDSLNNAPDSAKSYETESGDFSRVCDPFDSFLTLEFEKK